MRISFVSKLWYFLFCFYRKYHNFERNEIRATVFLKWPDFSRRAESERSIRFFLTVFNFKQPYDWPLSPVLQGQSWQNGYLNQLWEIEICMQVRFVWKVLLKFWDLRNFASSTSFHKMCNLHHLWPNWQTHKKTL